jgi:hypothetical protein
MLLKKSKDSCGEIESVCLDYVPAWMLCVCLFLVCFRTNVTAHAADISTYKFSGQINSTVISFRGKKEMFEETKIVKC